MEQAPPSGPPSYPQLGEEPAISQYGYFGPHPIPWDQGSGYCAEAGPHFHPYPPFDKYLFRESQGYFHFIGDAADFGFAAQTWGYHGNHPIPPEYGGGWCYIDWDHRHPYPPRVGVTYSFVGGYYLYGGVWDPLYYRDREYYHSYYNGYYRSNYYGHRYYEARPRAVYRAEPRAGSPGVYRRGDTVREPSGRAVVVVQTARPIAPAPRPTSQALVVHSAPPAPAARTSAPPASPRPQVQGWGSRPSMATPATRSSAPAAAPPASSVNRATMAAPAARTQTQSMAQSHAAPSAPHPAAESHPASKAPPAHKKH